jgi:anti-sigma factor (TIGR02949 family)
MTMHECRDRSRMLGSYLDGQLDPTRLIDIDEHLARCENCREEARLLQAMRSSLKRTVQTGAPSGLRERIANTMAAERARESARATGIDGIDGDGFAETGPFGGRASWRSTVPLATAAALALLWGAATRGPVPTTGTSARAGFGDDLLSMIVAEHSRPLPPETTDPQAVRRFEQYVGVPVRPASFERGGARLVGGRVLPLHSQRAAMLQYELGTGARVSVLVYDAEKIQIGTANLAPREIGTAEVRVGQEKGYSVAATERAGVGYLLASDLDPDKSAQLAAMVYDDRR